MLLLGERVDVIYEADAAIKFDAGREPAPVVAIETHDVAELEAFAVIGADKCLHELRIEIELEWPEVFLDDWLQLEFELIAVELWSLVPFQLHIPPEIDRQLPLFEEAPSEAVF